MGNWTVQIVCSRGHAHLCFKEVDPIVQVLGALGSKKGDKCKCKHTSV